MRQVQSEAFTIICPGNWIAAPENSGAPFVRKVPIGNSAGCPTIITLEEPIAGEVIAVHGIFAGSGGVGV